MEIVDQDLVKKRKKAAAYQRKWRKNNPEKVKEYWKKHYRKYPRWAQDRALRQQIGVTLEQKEDAIKKQNGRCGGCGTTKPGGKWNRWVADHIVFGKLRGILCSNCNLALGHAKESIKILEGLIQYLRGAK